MALYGLIDAARNPQLYDLVRAEPEHACLFAGKLEPALARAAPYLAKLLDDGPLLSAWRKQGRGQSWGIACTSRYTLDQVRRHFRHFLKAKLPDGRVVMFRFYDPRVWRVYIPTCTPEQLAEWFTRADEYTAEMPNGAGTITYTLESGALKLASAS